MQTSQQSPQQGGAGNMGVGGSQGGMGQGQMPQQGGHGEEMSHTVLELLCLL